MCTSGAEGAAAPEYHWGHHLLTAQHHCCSCPHTESQQQAHLLPCLPCWSLFLPSGLLETGWEQQLRRSPLHRPALLSLTSFHHTCPWPYSSAFILHIHSHSSTFPLPAYTDGGRWQIAICHTFVFTLPSSHKLLLLP